MGAKKGTNVLRDSIFSGWKFNARHNYYVKFVEAPKIGVMYIVKLYLDRNQLLSKFWAEQRFWEKKWSAYIYTVANKDVVTNPTAQIGFDSKDVIYETWFNFPQKDERSLKKVIELTEKDVIPAIENLDKPIGLNGRMFDDLYDHCDGEELVTPRAIAPVTKKFAEIALAATMGVQPEDEDEDVAMKDFIQQMTDVVNGKRNFLVFNWNIFRLLMAIDNWGFKKFHHHIEFLNQVWEYRYFRFTGDIKKLATPAAYKNFVAHRDEYLKEFIEGCKGPFTVFQINDVEKILKGFDINEVEKLI
jgi:hypothetical protein